MADSLLQQLARLRPLALPLRWQWAGCAVLAVLCALAVMRLAALLLAEPVLPSVQFPVVATAQQPASVRLYPEAGVPAAATQELAAAAVNARLLGVIFSASKPIANLAVNGGKERPYKVGDELAPGVILERIEATQVVVRERGALRKIALASLLDNQAPIQMAGGEPMTGHDVAPLQHMISQSRPTQPAATQTMPTGFSLEIGEDGTSGLRIGQVNEALAALGTVEAGDLIVAVDGVALSELAANNSAMAQLAERDTLQITVMRRGSRLELDVDGAAVHALLGAQ